MRTRLGPEQRRAQLLAIGGEVFARRPYEQVSVEEVAEIAQISCGLLYHYFPSKWDFFMAVAEQEGAKLLEATDPDPTLPLAEQVRAGLEVYIDYAEQHPDSFRMIQQTAVTNQDRRHMHQTRIDVHCDRILSGLRTAMPVQEHTRIAVVGWLAFVETVVLNWLDNRAIPRGHLSDLCIRTFWSAVGLRPEAVAALGG